MLVLSNAFLIDGTGGEPVKKSTIIIEGNCVTSVGLQQNYLAKARVIDLKGLAVMPGLIDCHVHFTGVLKPKPGQPPSMEMVPSRSYVRARKLSIENGVTSIRTGGDYYPEITIVRDKINSGTLYGPRIFAAGPFFTSPGGHPVSTFLREFPHMVDRIARVVTDPKTAREEVKKLVFEGNIDHIKVIINAFNPWDPAHPPEKLSFKVFQALADEAHKYNRRVMVHTESPDDAFNAVKMGADSIEHLVSLGPDARNQNILPDNLIKIMLDRDIYYVPTLAVSEMPFIPIEFRKSVNTLKIVVKRLYDAGVNITTGTDSGGTGLVFGKAVHQEMEMMVKLGMSPMAATVAATRNAAGAIGKINELGTIEKGKLADILVVSGNPTNNIMDIKNIKLVIKNGKVLVDDLRN